MPYDNKYGLNLSRENNNILEKNLDFKKKRHLLADPENAQQHFKQDFKNKKSHLDLGYEYINKRVPQQKKGAGLFDDILSGATSAGVGALMAGKKQSKQSRENEKLAEEIFHLKKKGAGLFDDVLSGVTDAGMGALMAGKKQSKQSRENEKLAEEIYHLKKNGAGWKDEPHEIAPSFIGGKTHKAKKGGSLFDDLLSGATDAGVGALMAGKRKKKEEKDGAGILDNGKKMLEGLKNILSKKGTYKDFLKIYSLGHYGGKKDFISAQERLNDIEENGGAKYNKSRPLLFPQEMAATNAFGGAKKSNAWQQCIKNTKKQHPELKGLREIIDFIKKNNLY